jgi:hypothetical protein
MRVCVIGGSTVDDHHYDRARSVGQTLGRRGHTVVCGGLTGVMEGVCEGAVAAGGDTIGILPGRDPADANPHVQTAIATGLGNARNALVVLNANAAIAIDGAYGTLSEIALALDADLPVAALDSHDVDGVVPVSSPTAAVDAVEERAGGE